jgi:hypothetical protein
MLMMFIFASPAYASNQLGCENRRSNGFFSIPVWYEYLPMNPDCTINTDTSNGGVNAGTLTVLILMGVFDILMFGAGFLAVIMIIYGSFRFLTSTGDSNKIAAARTTIFNAIVGLVIAVFASQLVGFIATRFNS